MLIAMLVSLVLGLLLAFIGILPAQLAPIADALPYYCLCVILFLVGFSTGRNRAALHFIRRGSIKMFIIPICTIFGTLFGGFVASFVVDITAKEGVLVSAGFGWYSYSAVYLAEACSEDLGAISFISNVLRETLAIFAAPFVCRLFGSPAAIAIAGCPSMDVLLPIISRYAGEEMAVISFINGLILSLITPLLLPILVAYI